jgi:hypothetical protein
MRADPTKFVLQMISPFRTYGNIGTNIFGGLAAAGYKILTVFFEQRAGAPIFQEGKVTSL